MDILKPVKPKKPAKPVNGRFRSNHWWMIGIACLLSGGMLAYGVCYAAQKVVDNIEQTAEAAVHEVGGLVESFGKFMAVSASQGLMSGEVETRLTILNQITELDFESSTVPSHLVEAVKGNLDHESLEIRAAAEKAMASIEKATVVDSDPFGELAGAIGLGTMETGNGGIVSE